MMKQNALAVNSCEISYNRPSEQNLTSPWIYIMCTCPVYALKMPEKPPFVTRTHLLKKSNRNDQVQSGCLFQTSSRNWPLNSVGMEQ